MSGTPNWNPRLQTSSVRFPRKAVETPQIPPNTTARPIPGAPFQPVYPNPITQIPTITATANPPTTPSVLLAAAAPFQLTYPNPNTQITAITATADPSNPRPVFNQLYTLSAGFGEVIAYPGRRGVPTPRVILQKTNERYLVFGVNFPYQMSGTDRFIFTFTSLNTGEQIIKNFQPAPQYIVGGILPGVLYTLTVAPVVNGITYPGSVPPLGPLTITAVSAKNVQLQGVTLSGGDKTGFIQWVNATPQPPLAFEVTTVAVDDNFGTPQRLLNVIRTYPDPSAGERPTNYSGYVQLTNLINGSAYTFTITPYQETDGIFEYGQPTTLPSYIPGPPGDLVITGISADGSLNTVTLNVTYDTAVHPVPEATNINVYNSTLTTLCSLVGQSPTVVQDLSQTYAAFTTSTGLFTAQGFASIVSTVSSAPGSIQIDLLNDKGYFYTFPLTDVSTGELGYTFGNSNFVKTTNLISTASSYSVLIRNVILGEQRTRYVSAIGQTVLTIPNLPQGLYTFIGSNYANGLYSRVSTYTTIAGGKPGTPRSVPGGIVLGNQFVSLGFSGYDPTDTYPRPISYLYTENTTGKTYTSINSNILIGGLVNGLSYTFGIQGFGNGVYGASGQFSVTPAPQPPTNLSASISNYDVTISFAPAFGGADSYQIRNQSGGTVGLAGGLYKFLNLSANVGYTFQGQSFVYGSPVYTLTSTDPSTSIVEISSAYAQFLVRPSVTTLSYASTMITNIQYFVPYNYTISGGGDTYSFPITSMTSVYDTSGTLLWYNVANTNIAKAAVTFSGATTYTTTLSTTVPLFPGMVPTTSSGTISSAFSLPTTPSAFVGPPTGFFVSTSLASSQRIDISIQVASLVVPSRYYYTEITGKNVSGFSDSTRIVIDNLSSGLSYTFSISAFGNQVYGLTGISAGPYLLATAAPSNGVATFSNTTASVTFSGYSGTGITYSVIMYENGYPGRIVTFLEGQSTSYTFSPIWANAGTKYGFTIQGVDPATIFSVFEIIDPIIAGAPATPCNIAATLSSDSITFNWSSGNTVYNETYNITEYLSNNGVRNPTGVAVSGLSSRTYTISSVITASGTQVFGYNGFIEQSPGYASFVLLDTGITSLIAGAYTSNQVWLTLQQSGLTYTFPLSTVTPFGTGSNTFANAAYSKDSANIFDPLLSLSVTYSYGTGPRNGGTYSYEFSSYTNQVYSAPSNVGINMFVQPVLGIPSVSVTGTAATVSFAQTNPAGTVYRVTNNYGATISRAPYRFANLSVGTSFPYTFSVVASNGVFVSVSSELSPPIYVGPPPIPLLGASYFGQVATVTAIDTTISLTTVFYDTGTQNTGQNVWTVSHGNVIQDSSGGFWNDTLPAGYGSIKDSDIGFVFTTPSSYAMYSNDGYSNARYQFTAAPSTGTITATLSAYSLIMSGSSLVVTNAGVQVYIGTTLSPSYTVQFFSYSNGFGIQSGAGGGNNLLYYSQVPADSDSLEFTITDAASFSNFQASRIQNVGPATVSYGIVDQFRIVYNPSLQSATYTPSGLQYAYSIVNIPYAITLTFGVTPYANNVSGPTAFVDIYLYTGSPGTPQVSIYDTSATITVPKVSLGSVDTYFLDIITGGVTISTLSRVSTASAAYIFQYAGLTPHLNYFFSTYATYNGVQTTTGPVTVGPFEAGKPYSNTDFSGLVSATIGNPNTTTGTYTISALVNPGKNSNAAITTSVYTGSTFVKSQTINTSQQQVFSFTVSSGLVYSLSTTAFMNGFTANSANPSISLSANPFPPRTVALTISSVNLGQTYGGAITVTAASATPNVLNIYGYTENGISTQIGTGNTFTAVYNSSYTGYAYTIDLTGTLSSSITYSTVCNVSLSTPTNVQVDYISSNITLTWSGATDGRTGFYTVIASNTTNPTTTISQNIPYSGIPRTLTYGFSGEVGNNYTFTVRGQSQRNPSASLIYSPPVSVGVSLSTESVNPTVDYSGAKITVSFGIANLTTFSSLYTFGVTCVCGSVTNPGDYPNTYPYQSISPFYAFTASGLGQILRFSVQPLLKGILGPATFTRVINLTTSALTNISQSYTRNIYTISWTPITHTPGYSYTIQDVSDNVTPQTILTSASSSTQFTLSYDKTYQFQAYAKYNGIQSVISTLSRIYTYTLSSLGAPTTDYTGTTITVSWAAAQQADSSYATSYILRNVCGNPVTEPDRIVLGATTSSFVGIAGSNYRYTVTAVYNGISSEPTSPGDQIGLYTNVPTNVNVTNSGQNIIVTWSGSSWPPENQGTIFYNLSQIGNGTLTDGNNGAGRFTTSATVYAPNTTLSISSTAFYNYLITASAKGFTSSPFASATVCGFVFTYPPTNVFLSYEGIDTRSFHDISRTAINPMIRWVIPSSSTQYSSVYTVSLVNITNPTNLQGINKAVSTAPGITQWKNLSGSSTLNLQEQYNNYIQPYVYATNNGLASETVSGSPVLVYTAPPGVVGVGFDGLYRITFSLCRGVTADIPDYYTIWERNDAYKTNTQSGDYPLSYFTVSADKIKTSTIYTIPLTGIQGYTYDFAIYSTLCGVASDLNTTLSSYTLETKPVTTTAVSYSGTTITFSWSEAMQPIFDGNSAPPNVGYTIYVTPGNPFIPLINAYKRLSYNFVGTPGQSYYFTILAVNNNITSPPTQSDIVTLYQPVVTDLEATNTCENDRDVSMILTWTPDVLNASGAQYRAVSFNQSTGATVTSNNIGINSFTVTFTGSIGVAYTFFVQGIYSNICGLAQSVEISNARPRITFFSLTNIGNNIFADYTVTPVGSIVTLSAYNTTSATVVTSINYTSATTATLTVSSAVSPGITYSISATARYFGIPSTVCGSTYTMTQPAKPSSITATYNNVLVSVSWATAANASSYIFSAYDASTNQLTDIQTYIPQTNTTFIGTIGRYYNLSVTAYSSTFIPSVTASSVLSIDIPPPPTNLSLYNVGQLVTVRWNDSTAIYSNYSFTVVNVANPGTIFYRSTFASVSETFLATIGQTFRVSLCGTSYSNVTSTSSAVSSLFIYQPSIESVTATNVGADITLIFPPDPRTCEYYVTNNYGYRNLLYSPSKTLAEVTAMYNAITNSYAVYTQPTNGYISYTVANCSYNLVGAAYLFTVVPYFQLVSGQGARTPTVNPVTLYRPTLPTNVSVTSTGNTINLNWQYAEIYTSPANTAIATYKLEYSVADSCGGRYSLSGIKYPVGTTQSITGYDSGANAVSISLTAIIPSYDTNFGGNYINGYTFHTSYTIPNLQAISIQQRNGAIPTDLTVTIPQTNKPYIWFFTVAKNNVNPAQVPTTFPVVSNVQLNVGNTQTDYNITVSLGYYYTISAYGYDYPTGFNPDSIGAVPILPNPNPYPATTFNVSALSIFTSHSGLTTTISWLAVTGAEYYYIQEFPDGRTGAGDIGDNVIATTTLSKSFTHTDSARGKTFCYQITAVTPSGATYTNTQDKGISLSNRINPLFSPSPFSGDETLTVPGLVQSLTATQSLARIIVAWNYPQNIVNLTRSANSTNTDFAVTQSRTSPSSGRTTELTYIFPQSPTPAHGTQFSYGVTPTYYGITGSTQTASPEPLSFVNPAITSLTLTNNHNKTITLAGTANTPGDWFPNIGSASSPPATPTASNSTSFSLDQTVTPGSSWTGFVRFVATTGGLSVTSNTAVLNIQNPLFGIPVLTNNSSTLGASFTLTIATTGASAAGVINSWSIPTNDSTGTFSNTSSTLNSSNLTAVYQAISRPIVVPFVSAPFFESNTIVLTSDGFTVSNAKTSNFIPPTLVITATLGPTGAPAALNLGLNFTSNGAATVASLNFPTTIGGLTTSTSSPQSASSCNITYPAMLANTLYSTAATSVFGTFQEYKTFAAATSAQVNFSITDILFADNRDGTMKITGTRGAFSGGVGTPTFIAPTTIGTLNIIGLSSSQVTPAIFTYGTTTDNTQFTLNANAVSLVYSGITLTGPAASSTITARFPLVQNLTATYFGCIEDGPLTGANSITVTASANINSTWTITACSALTLNSSSGQGTTQIIFNFSGGRKGRNYPFTVGTCNVSVSLTKPTTTVTPSFSSFSLGSPAKTVTTAFSPAPSSASPVFVYLGSSGVTTTTNTQARLITGFTNDTIFTVSAAVISNGILGDSTSYQFAAPSTVTSITCGSTSGSTNKNLATSNTIFLGWANSGTAGGFVYNVYSNSSAPGTGVVTGAQTTKKNGTALTTNSFELTLTSGTNKIWIGKSITLNGVTYNSDFASNYSFDYSSSNFVNCNANTGGVLQSATMPTGFSVISADIVGGGGGGGSYYSAGGGFGIGGTGAWLTLKNFSVGSGEILYYYVGGGGGNGSTGVNAINTLFENDYDNKSGGSGGDWSFIFTSRDNGPYYAGGGGGGSSENHKGTVSPGSSGTSAGKYPTASTAGKVGPKVGGGWIKDLTYQQYPGSEYYNNPAYVAVGFNYITFGPFSLPQNYHIYYAVPGPALPSSGNIGGGRGGVTSAQYGVGGLCGSKDGTGSTAVTLTTANSTSRGGYNGGTRAATAWSGEPSRYNDSTTGPGAGGYNGTQGGTSLAGQLAGGGGRGVDGLVSITAFKCTVTIT